MGGAISAPLFIEDADIVSLFKEYESILFQYCSNIVWTVTCYFYSIVFKY